MASRTPGDSRPTASLLPKRRRWLKGKGGKFVSTKVTSTFKPQPPHPQHRGDPVKVGPYTIHLGGTRDLRGSDFLGYDLLVPLTKGGLDFTSRQKVTILPYFMEDFGGVPKDWREFLDEVIVELKAGKKILAFCIGSHGRTGCFLASLIALLEPECEDPIAAARERHCDRAVESLTQADAVFELRGETLPDKYEKLMSAAVLAPTAHKYASQYFGNGISHFDPRFGYVDHFDVLDSKFDDKIKVVEIGVDHEEVADRGSDSRCDKNDSEK